jgi:hypothetical protein
MHTKFLLEDLKGINHSEDLGVDWRIILYESKDIWWKDVNWIHVAQDRDQWWTLMNTIMSFQNL